MCKLALMIFMLASRLMAQDLRPDFSKVRLELAGPDMLWKRLTHPDTPYLERMAAAHQGQFPLQRLPALAAALDELRSERERSQFGLRPHPLESRPILSRSSGPGGPKLLGHCWTPPQPLQDYPMTWEQECRAPWPWQVLQALESLRGKLCPHDEAAANEWLDACLKLPLDNDRQAQMFVEFCQCSSHWKSIPVYQRLLKIALEPRLPVAAEAATRVITDSVRLWDHPDAQNLGLACTLEILRRSPHESARRRAAYGVRDLTRRWRPQGEVALPSPTPAILECLRMAQDPARGSDWTRLYAYGFSALEAMDTPVFTPNRRLDPSSPQVQEQLGRLRDWLSQHEAELKASCAAFEAGLKRARGLLQLH